MIFRAQSRTARMLLTAGASYLGRFGSGIVILVTLPMAREALSTELFGVWMMLTSLLAFLAFADLGVGNGVLNRITLAHATQDHVMLRRTLLSGYVVTAAVGVILLLSWLCWLQWSTEPTALAGKIAASNRTEVLNALSAFVVVLAINVPASLVQRIQLGMQEGYWNGIVQLLGAIMTLIAVPLTLQSGGTVAVLIFATLGIQAAGNVLNTLIWLGRHQFLRMKSWQGAKDSKTFVDLLRSGSLFFVLQVAAAFAFQSDAIVITQTLGQSAYGDFAVVQKLFLFVSSLLASAIVGLWPAFGDAVARKDTEWALGTLRRGVTFAAVTSVIGVSTLTIAMPWLMETWMDNTVKVSWSLITAIAVWTVIDSTTSVFAAYLNGANILRAQVIIAVVMAVVAFGGKWVLVPWFGVVGATVSTILAYSFISLPAQFFILQNILKSKDLEHERIPHTNLPT